MTNTINQSPLAGGETFHFLRWGFDITAVRALVARKNVKLTRTVVLVEAAARYLDSDPAITPVEERRSPLVGVVVDWDELDLLPVEALESPVFIAPLGKIGEMVIDGWHRIALARRNGIAELPGILLSRRQTQRVLLPGSAPLPAENEETIQVHNEMTI